MSGTSQLVIFSGTENYQLSGFEGVTYVYTIGSGKLESRDFVSVNNPIRLHEIAIEERDEYARWIYSFNQTFLNRRLVFDEILASNIVFSEILFLKKSK